MCALDSFGVPVVVKAADIVTCRCEGCELPKLSAEAVTRWQAEPVEFFEAGKDIPVPRPTDD